MEVLNETAYDTSDLEKVVRYAREKAQESETRRSRQQSWGGVRTVQPLPDQIRFGYYNNPKPDEEKQGRRSHKTVDVCFVSQRGNTYHSTGAIRIGIAPPLKLPLNEMAIIALAASDKNQRTLPNQVLADLVVVLMRTLFHAWVDRNEEEWILDGCPPVHYDHKANRDEVKAAREEAREAQIARVKRLIRWAEDTIRRCDEKRGKEAEKLIRLRARLLKLENKKEMSHVGSQ